MDNPFDTINEPIGQRVITGLSKIGIALRSQSWQGAEAQGLTPTQGQILALLQSSPKRGIRLSTIAKGLATSAATASDAVSSLVKKGLVSREKATDDRRAIAIRLTPKGQKQAEKAASWPDFLLSAVTELSEEEQTIFFRGLTKMIQKLQSQGKIPPSRMCVTCEYFRANVYEDADRPHHCMLVDAPFGDRDLRLDCPEHQEKEAAIV
ncbi:MarR family transcriptional regulator [Leptolyngbyaceae cyanobacterium CCMR0082]|uniref:MarR family transcriptional regulator n=2 Tax=Adonisia turfae TaxID=2950184 RepID=A0A6M0SHV6_9CYAN|nr:MarR family winged helix-turn-helix transcriptional regulator [Adonisia turfae]NEZ56105.1 MarR family transcriptional regulator [Adonisia turfae CCMR0081]NEZ67192.1 MarR family transcriptional regulator [Adonisia turfae CCMR0082]